ncbi:hypothetical protein JCM10213_002313 [Rhodosporidiobolus nylandii]
MPSSPAQTSSEVSAPSAPLASRASPSNSKKGGGRKRARVQEVTKDGTKRQTEEEYEDVGEESEPVWTSELDELLKKGLSLVPKLRSRTVYLPRDTTCQPHGRHALVGEYIRRQTGKLRTRSQIGSHLGILKKSKQYKDDKEFLSLCEGQTISSEAFASTDWDLVLGPDLHPESLAAKRDAYQAYLDGLIEKGAEQAKKTLESSNEPQKEKKTVPTPAPAEEEELRPKQKKRRRSPSSTAPRTTTQSFPSIPPRKLTVEPNKLTQISPLSDRSPSFPRPPSTPELSFEQSHHSTPPLSGSSTLLSMSSFQRQPAQPTAAYRSHAIFEHAKKLAAAAVEALTAEDGDEW